MQNFWLILTTIVQLLPSSAGAQVYKWTDQEGRVQYGEQPPENKPAKRVECAIVASPTALVEVEIEDSTMK